MVEDVRQKISMRLTAKLERLWQTATRDPGVAQKVVLARTDRRTARDVQAWFRSEIVREFPGCEVTFSRSYIYLKLPDNYPASNVPIMGTLSPPLVECFSPKGLVKMEGWED